MPPEIALRVVLVAGDEQQRHEHDDLVVLHRLFVGLEYALLLRGGPGWRRDRHAGARGGLEERHKW
jgi:hypothetical protein